MSIAVAVVRPGRRSSGLRRVGVVGPGTWRVLRPELTSMGHERTAPAWLDGARAPTAGGRFQWVGSSLAPSRTAWRHTHTMGARTRAGLHGRPRGGAPAAGQAQACATALPERRQSLRLMDGAHQVGQPHSTSSRSTLPFTLARRLDAHDRRLRPALASLPSGGSDGIRIRSGRPSMMMSTWPCRRCGRGCRSPFASAALKALANRCGVGLPLLVAEQVGVGCGMMYGSQPDGGPEQAHAGHVGVVGVSSKPCGAGPATGTSSDALDDAFSTRARRRIPPSGARSAREGIARSCCPPVRFPLPAHGGRRPLEPLGVLRRASAALLLSSWRGCSPHVQRSVPLFLVVLEPLEPLGAHLFVKPHCGNWSRSMSMPSSCA
jgi:hypothetical protein